MALNPHFSQLPVLLHPSPNLLVAAGNPGEAWAHGEIPAKTPQGLGAGAGSTQCTSA